MEDNLHYEWGRWIGRVKEMRVWIYRHRRGGSMMVWASILLQVCSYQTSVGLVYSDNLRKQANDIL